MNENEQAKKPIVWSAALTYANEGAKKQSKDWLQFQTDAAEAPELRQQIFSFVRTVSDLHARLGKIAAARNEACEKLEAAKKDYDALQSRYVSLQKEHAAMIGANKPKKKSGK